MPTYEVKFHYQKTVTLLVEANSDQDLHNSKVLLQDDFDAEHYLPNRVVEDWLSPEMEVEPTKATADFRLVDGDLEQIPKS